MSLSRRGLLVGLLAAPIIVRAGGIMPVRALPDEMLQTYDSQFVHDVRQSLMGDLSQWWASRMDAAIFNQLSAAP